MTRLGRHPSPWEADEAASADAGPLSSGSAAPPPPAPSGQSNVWNLVRLVVVVAALCAVFALAGLAPYLVVIAAIVVIVMVHELGHFATAKWSHMKVTEYFVGFGPRLWSIRRGETEYGVKAIPAGGYVKIPGMSNLEEIDPGDEERTYRRQPFHKRIIVASAGSFMHFVMAFLLAYGAIAYFGNPTSVHITVEGFTGASSAQKNPAEQATLRKGDVIVGVGGKAITSITSFSTEVQGSEGRALDLTVERAGKLLHLTVTPAAGHRLSTTPTAGVVLGKPTRGKAYGAIGISESPVEQFSPENPVRAVGTAVIAVGREVALTVRTVPEGISNLYRDLTTTSAAKVNQLNGKRAMSVIGIVHFATQAEQNGALTFIEVLIAINIAFALLNMLPMLPLDGGHVAIAIYERIRTRRGRPYYQADAAKLMPVAYGFLAVLLVIVVSAAYLDIVYPVTLR